MDLAHAHARLARLAHHLGLASLVLVAPTGCGGSALPASAPAPVPVADFLCAGAGAGAGAAQELAPGRIVDGRPSTNLANLGVGFFAVRRGGETSYTRRGEFVIEGDHFALPDGSILLGAADGPDRPGALSPVTVPGRAPPHATTRISVAIWLDANDVAPAAWDNSSFARGVATSNYVVSPTVYDSLGEAHVASFFFRYTGAANTWEWHVTVDGAETTGGVPGVLVEIGNGTLVFDADGALSSMSTAANTADFVGARQGQALDFDFGPLGGPVGPTSSRFAAGPDYLPYFFQDGFAGGPVTDVSVRATGEVDGQSGDRHFTFGKIALARFGWPAALLPVGDFRFVPGACSGPAELHWPGDLDVGTVLAGALEE